MCGISISYVQRFQSWYFPDKPYYIFVMPLIHSSHYALVICIHSPLPTGMGGDNDFSLFRALV